MKDNKTLKIIILITGILTVLLGIYTLVRPMRTFLSIGWILGILLFVNGIELVALSLSKEKKEIGACILGVLEGLAGLVLLFSGIQRFITDVMAAYMVGAVILIYGIFQIVGGIKTYSTSKGKGILSIICGILSVAVFQQIESEVIWDGMTWLGLFTIIILGTVVSFNAYIEGVRRIGAVQGSILSSLEPISAALFGWALLGNEFTLVGIFGMFCIIATIFIIAWDRQRQLKRDVLEKLNKEEIA